MGSADALNVTQRIIDLLEDYPRILFLDVLIGAEYGHGNALGHALQRSKHRYEIHRSVEDVVSLYQAVDVAITAAGVTLWELSSAGVPMLVVQTHEAQTGVAEYVRNERVATVLGWHERLTAP